MAYVLRWGGQQFSTSSQYECIMKKNKLRREGVEFTEQLTGDEKRTEMSKAKMKRWTKLRENVISGTLGKKIQSFLGECEKAEKNCVKFGKVDDANRRTNRCSEKVGKKKSHLEC